MTVTCQRYSSILSTFAHGGRCCADLVLAGMDCDKAVVCTLRHEERLRSGGSAYIQAALLYTTPSGQRRVRVHTLALPIAGSLGSVFRGADLDATLQVFAPRPDTRRWMSSRSREAAVPMCMHPMHACWGLTAFAIYRRSALLRSVVVHMTGTCSEWHLSCHINRSRLSLHFFQRLPLTGPGAVVPLTPPRSSALF